MMKKIMKILFIIVVMVCCMEVGEDAYAQSVLPRTLMKYQMEESTSLGNVTVNVVITVNDGTSTIVDYSVESVEAKNGATNASVAASGIAAGGKQVYVTVNYSYAGTYRTETIYFGI